MELPKYIINSIINNKTSLGEHPAFPPEEEEKFILSIVKSYFSDIAKNVEVPSIDEARIKLGKLIKECVEIENANKEALEKLAQDVITDMFDIPADTVQIDVNIVNKVNSDDERLIPEKTVDFGFENISDMRSLTDEVYKRRLLNALIMGASVKYSEDITRYIQELFKINPELPSLYKRIIDLNKLLIYLTKDSIADNQKTNAGRVDVYMGSDEKQPQIKAQALFFPILIEETIKGILELAISHGLPDDRKRAEYVTMKSDFKLAELWDIRLGYPLWERIEKVIEKCGKDAQEIGLNFIFMHISALPVDDFNEFMQEVFMGTKQGCEMMSDMLSFIEHEKESDDFDDFMQSNGQQFQLDDSEYFSPDELLSEQWERKMSLTEAMNLADIKQKYYADIDDNAFQQIIQSDPTYNPDKPDKMGKFGKWLLNIYKTNNLKLEDLYKAKEYLSTFVRFSNKIDKKDINQYKSLPELYTTVKPFLDNPDQATSKSDEARRAKENADKVYEDDTWLIVIPRTEEASCYYGKGTQWCTAADVSDNMFDSYNSQGPLYININKKNGEKYQFHFETESYMDAEDSEIVGQDEEYLIADRIGLTKGAYQYYRSLGHCLKYEDSDLTNMLEDCCVGYDWDSYEGSDDEEREQLMADFADNLFNQFWSQGLTTHDFSISPWNENWVQITLYGRQTYIDVDFRNKLDGKWFDNVYVPKCGWARVREGKLWNFYNPTTDTYMFDKWVDYVEDFNTDYELAVVEANGKWNLYNRAGQPVLPQWYERLSFTDNYKVKQQWLKVQLNGKWNLMTLNGHYLLDKWADAIGFFGNNYDKQTREALMYVTYRGQGNYYADEEGNLRDPFNTSKIVYRKNQGSDASDNQ